MSIDLDTKPINEEKNDTSSNNGSIAVDTISMFDRWLVNEWSLRSMSALTLSVPRSRFGDKVLMSSPFCPQNGTAVLKGLGKKKNAGDAQGMEGKIHYLAIYYYGGP